MSRSKIVVALSLSLAVAGMSRTYAQNGEGTGPLTALDYAQIQQLYASYNWAVDLGDAEGRDYAGTYVPDGVFINVVPAPASGSCPAAAGWRAADRTVIRGTMADRLGANMCVTTRNGSQELADLAKGIYMGGRRSSRHSNTNIKITPAPGGATGFAYLVQMSGSSVPPVLSPSGFYEDTLVKTPAGWRFKRRIRTEDRVIIPPATR